MHATEDISPPTEHIKVLTVKNKLGIHARPAAMIVRLTNDYKDTNVFVQKCKDGEEVNGKSIMGIMILAAGYNTDLKFKVSGPDAQQLIEKLSALFDRKFDEI